MTADNQRRHTIYDLSKKLGIHASTISVVLNGTWQKRRISADTAKLILDHADEINFMPNRQAQGLRKATSRMVGLMIPSHDSRFFASIAQAFETQVRRQLKCPIVVSAGRDAERELETARTLISYAVEALVVCGARNPDGIHDACKAVGLPHINVDLPGSKAASVVSDNFDGGTSLTDAIVSSLQRRLAEPADVHFFGGEVNAATEDRVKGFKTIIKKATGKAPPESTIHLTGYDAQSSQAAFERHFAQHGRIPAGLFINGPGNYEGFLRFAASVSIDPATITIGCFDFDPLASFSVFETWMIKQDADGMIIKAFELLDKPEKNPKVYYIKPELVPPQLGGSQRQSTPTLPSERLR